ERRLELRADADDQLRTSVPALAGSGGGDALDGLGRRRSRGRRGGGGRSGGDRSGGVGMAGLPGPTGPRTTGGGGARPEARAVGRIEATEETYDSSGGASRQRLPARMEYPEPGIGGRSIARNQLASRTSDSPGRGRGGVQLKGFPRQKPPSVSALR